MGVEQEIQLSDVLRTGAKIVGAGFLAAIPGTAFVTAYHHRQLTHRSLELDPKLIEAGNREMAVYSPTSEIWAAVHRLHHHFPDATLAPAWRIAQAIKWVEANPLDAGGIEIPDYYPYLDLFVPRFHLNDVLTMGHFADEYLRDRLGGTYQPPFGYSKDELYDLLHPNQPMYLYPEERHKKGTEYSQDEIAEILLGDPHSPARMRRRNGVRGILESNVMLYHEASALFRARPDLMPKDLQVTEMVDPVETRINAFIEQSLKMASLVSMVRGKHKPEDELKALLAGVAITTVKLGFHIAGGNITNSLGHAGEMSPRRLLEAIAAQDYELTLNDDGTIATDAVYGGILGRAVSWITGDEVGGQRVHHDYPDKIAYTLQRGLRAWFEAPWGSFLEVLAENPYIPFIKTGEGFDVGDRANRPDMPSPAALLIEQRRIENRDCVKLQAA